jgi:hypothetical protein
MVQISVDIERGMGAVTGRGQGCSEENLMPASGVRSGYHDDGTDQKQAEHGYGRQSESIPHAEVKFSEVYHCKNAPDNVLFFF